MTVEPPVSTDAPSAVFQRIWVDCLRAVLSQVAGVPVIVEAEAEGESEATVAAADSSEVGVVYRFSNVLTGEMAILSASAGAVQLAQILTSEPADPSAAFDVDRREAYQELLNQVAGQVATSVKAAAKDEVEIKPSGSGVPAWQPAIRSGIRIAADKLGPIHLSLALSKELAESLRALEAKDRSGVADAEPAFEPRSDSVIGRNSNLELLLDVTLDATIRFGEKQMLLRDVLELYPGVAIALDRKVQEPVELLVGGRIVACGEVVIVDGNYGLRVTEIITPQQRIATLQK
jgi:flagellar motor switch protein FliN/FliY